jgi:predicted AAA+ superfamily ATPase
MQNKYMPRIVDRAIDAALATNGAVLIEGPRWCGKTWTAREKSKSQLLTQDMADCPKTAELMPRLLDDWHMAPSMLATVRSAAEELGRNGQFILTGSDMMAKDIFPNRLSHILMRPMSLFESGESNGQVSLKGLFQGNAETGGYSGISVEKFASLITRGGWPASVCEAEEITVVKDITRDSFGRGHKPLQYYVAVILGGINRVDGIKKNPDRVQALLRSLAMNTATTVPCTIIRDEMGEDERNLSEKTMDRYMKAMRQIFVVEDLPPWFPELLSKTELRTSPKRHLVDPSIAATVLQLTPRTLLEDSKTFGALFESLCVRDLRIYAQANDGEVFHYHDKKGLSADAIVTLKDGRWGAVEVETEENEIDNAARNLIKLREKVDSGKMGEPSFLMILAATRSVRLRNDGVIVVPLGCLRD